MGSPERGHWGGVMVLNHQPLNELKISIDTDSVKRTLLSPWERQSACLLNGTGPSCDPTARAAHSTSPQALGGWAPMHENCLAMWVIGPITFRQACTFGRRGPVFCPGSGWESSCQRWQHGSSYEIHDSHSCDNICHTALGPEGVSPGTGQGQGHPGGTLRPWGWGTSLCG